MKRSRRSWWVIYAFGVLLALGALAWITRTVLQLERREHVARCDAQHQESLRLSLWRMDSWFGVHLAREAARPFYEYLPYYAHERAYTRILNRIESGEVLSPSPLLTFRSELVRIHFQIDEQGEISSPQVPTGNLQDLAESSVMEAAELEHSRGVLRELEGRIHRDRLVSALSRSEAQLALVLAEPPRQLDPIAGADLQMLKNVQEVSARAQTSYRTTPNQKLGKSEYASNWSAATEVTSIEIGPLVPLWIERPDGSSELAFVRRVRGGDRELLQGFIADWEVLSRRLLGQIVDLLPVASLAPVRGALGAEGSGLQLASIPARLEAPLPPPGATPPGPARATLILSWVAALLAALAVGWALHSSVLYGDKRSRFASTVTHELRTPLTTFRMYSEMLARDMVPEADRAEYLETLQRESDRLAGLVDNVLAYSRLEEGRSPLRRSVVAIGDLLERALPTLDRRVREAGMELGLDAESVRGVEVETDPEAVQQILFNLIDNACKYGRAKDGAALELSAVSEDGKVQLRVRDHGAGVPSAHARSIFHPFERGGRDPADPNPGVGLGLALSRGLARDLGGDLVLESGNEAGASFLLTLRRAT